MKYLGKIQNKLTTAVVVVSGSYGHACSVHPPSWVSCSLHFVHFMLSEVG